MEVQILKEEYKKAIKDDVDLKALLCKANDGISIYTLDRWRTSDDPMLTTATNLGIIRRHLKIKSNVVLTEAKEVSHV